MMILARMTSHPVEDIEVGQSRRQERVPSLVHPLSSHRRGVLA
jgi:hypothetical protein